MLTTHEIAERIEALRKQRNLTQVQLAEAVGLSRATWITIAKGERRLSSAELVQIAKALSVELPMLLHPHASVAAASPLFRRQMAALEDPRVERDVELALTWARRYVALEKLLEIRRRPATLEALTMWQVAEGDAERDPAGAGRAAAQAVRNLLSLGDGPFKGLEGRLAVEGGLRIFHLDLVATVGGFFFHSAELGACVFLNRSHPSERRRFTLAHELGHFLRDRERGDLLVGQHRSNDPAERFADAFAIEVLVPQNGLQRQYQLRRVANGDRFTVIDIVGLADAFEVSFEDMTRRLEELNLVRRGLFDQLRDQRFRPEDARAELGLTRGRTRPLAFPEPYLALAITAYDLDLISEGQLADYLGLDIIDTRDLYQSRSQAMADDGARFQIDVGLEVAG